MRRLSTECECGLPKTPGDPAGCPRCRALQATRKENGREKSGVQQDTDGFADVNEACTLWPRQRGIPIGDKILPSNPLV